MRKIKLLKNKRNSNLSNLLDSKLNYNIIPKRNSEITIGFPTG